MPLPKAPEHIRRRYEFWRTTSPTTAVWTRIVGISSGAPGVIAVFAEDDGSVACEPVLFIAACESVQVVEGDPEVPSPFFEFYPAIMTEDGVTLARDAVAYLGMASSAENAVEMYAAQARDLADQAK